jgi:hypothetical protein
VLQAALRNGLSFDPFPFQQDGLAAPGSDSTVWPPEADRVDRPDGQDEAGSADDCFWDVATIDEIDAKQRKPSSAGLQGHLYGRHDGTTAVPSEADSRRSSTLGQGPT